MQGAYALVLGGSSTSNLLEQHHCTDSKVCRVLSHAFGVVRVYRTFSNYIVTGETRCSGCLCTSSEKVQGGSMRLNHPELVHKHPAHLVSPVQM